MFSKKIKQVEQVDLAFSVDLMWNFNTDGTIRFVLFSRWNVQTVYKEAIQHQMAFKPVVFADNAVQLEAYS